MTYKQQWRKMLKLKKYGFINGGYYFSKKYKNFTLELTPRDDKVLINVVIDNENWFRGFLPYINNDYSALTLANVYSFAKQEYKELTN